MTGRVTLLTRSHAARESQWCRRWRVLRLELHHLMLHVDAWCHLLSGHHDATSSAQRLNPQINQVLLRQSRKDGHIDFTIDEVLDVMRKPNAGQQCFDVIVLRQLAALSVWSWVEQRCCHVEESTNCSVRRFSIDPRITTGRRLQRCRRCSRNSSSLPWERMSNNC